MAQIICEVTDGLRPAEATVMVTDFKGRQEFLPTDREFLSREGSTFFLPVGLIHVDEKQKAALVELPCESDSGANRIWVKLESLQANPS